MITGAIVSATVSKKLQSVVFNPSLAVIVIVVLPAPTNVPAGGSWLTVVVWQLSLAVARVV